MAKIKTSAEDFVVQEIPAYEPCGDGDHLFIRFTKVHMTTDAAIGAFARALGVKARDVGAAGMKDRIAVTEQTISVPFAPGRDEQAMKFVHEGNGGERITVHEARRHTNKLKTGHLRGNRFTIVVRDVDQPEEKVASLEKLAKVGVPNAFGTQRFGRAGDNADRARAWLLGNAPPPRDPRMKRLLFSSLQSAVFNEVLARRVADGTWSSCLEGDLVKLRDTGGLFLCTDVQADRPRAESGEISATGPLPGAKMREPAGVPQALEHEVTRELFGEGFDWGKVSVLGEGTRRALRLWVSDLTASVEQGQSIRVYFVLPKGAYATTVLSAAMTLQTTADDPRAATNPAEPTEN
jgi:tRNA pseudouridine13 synthase